MSHFLFSNNDVTTLAAPISNTSTTCVLQTGSGALFPNPSTGQYFTATITSATTPGLFEIVWVTARSGDTCTITRAHEGTSAENFLAGDTFSNLITAGSLNSYVQPDVLGATAGYYAVDSGSGNGVVISLSAPPATLGGLVGTPLRIQKSGTPNTGGSSLTVNTFASTPIGLPNYGPLTGGELPANGLFTAIYDGTIFQLQSNLIGSFVGANQGLGGVIANTDGFQKLPGGVIIQWWNYSALASQFTQTLSIPVAFPNAAFFVFGQIGWIIPTSSWRFTVGCQPISNSQFIVTLASDIVSPEGVWFIAFGY